jgi:hypothetical protein
MATPGPVYFEQLERDERQARLADRKNAEAFVKRRFAPLLRRADVRHVLDVSLGNIDNHSIGEIICDVAEKIGASAVVMAPHGKGRVREWFVGSVCNHCVHHANTPLVIVRPEKKNKSDKGGNAEERGERDAGEGARDRGRPAGRNAGREQQTAAA